MHGLFSPLSRIHDFILQKYKLVIKSFFKVRNTREAQSVEFTT